VFDDGAHKHLRYAAAPVLRHDKNIRHIGEGGKVRNDSGKPDLLTEIAKPLATK